MLFHAKKKWQIQNWNNSGGQNVAGAQVVILNSAVRYWIYKVWTAPGRTPIEQSA